MNLDDVLFILFRHKWKILFCAALGIAAAASAYLFKPRLYESEAKLMVRYVVDRSAVDTLDSQPKNSDIGSNQFRSADSDQLGSCDASRQRSGCRAAAAGRQRPRT